MKKLDYLVLSFLVIGSIPFGALMIAPIFFIFGLVKKDNLTPVFSALVVYSIVSVALGSFNVLLFAAIMASFLLIKYRSFGVIIGISALCILSAVMPTPQDYVLIVFWIIGLAMLGLGSDQIRKVFSSSPKEEIRDPILQRYEEIEKELGLK